MDDRAMRPGGFRPPDAIRGFSVSAGLTGLRRAVALHWMSMAAFGRSLAVCGAVSLMGPGLGLVPRAVAGVRGLAARQRELVRRWTGVEIPDPPGPLPAAPAGRSGVVARYRWIMSDPGTRREYVWVLTDPIAGGLLAFLPLALVLSGLWGVFLAFYGVPLSASWDGLWYGFVPVEGRATAVLAGVLGLLQLPLALWAAPRVVRRHALYTRAMLAPGESELMAGRIRHLAATRSAAVDTQMAEIRRIERDLHDGAQARLVAMGMTLDAAERLLETDPEAVRGLLAEARQSSSAALEELRDLVRGIHPPVLADRGLADAVRALAMSCPVPHRGPGRVAGPPRDARRVRRVLRRVRDPRQRRQARGGRPGLDRPPPRARGAAHHRDRRRSRRRRRRPRHRPAGHRTTARHLRRCAGREQPGGRTDDGDDGDPVRIVLAEDHFLLRDGLIRLLGAYGHDVVAAVDNGADLLAALGWERPDVAVVDVRPRRTSPTRACAPSWPPANSTRTCRCCCSPSTSNPSTPASLLAAGGGGVGYLLKDRVTHGAQFLEAIERVAAGGTAMDPEVVSRLLARKERDASVGSLTPREREVLELVAQGPLQRGHRAGPVCHREGRRQAHRQHLHQARPAPGRRRQPPGAGRTGPPEPVTRPRKRLRAASRPCGGSGPGVPGALEAQYRGRLNQAEAEPVTIEARMMPAIASEISPPKVAEPPSPVTMLLMPPRIISAA